jgi:hypothetical protein
LGKCHGESHTDVNAALTRNLSLEKVHKAIQALPKGKAPGRDGILIEFFQACASEVPPALLKAYAAMLARYDVEGLVLTRGGRIKDQTFADDTTLYLKGDPANLDRAQGVLAIFCKASGAKVRKERTWTWGQEVGLKWIPKGEGVRYLEVQVGFHLPTEANFDKMMVTLKGKLIHWSHSNLLLAGRILVANQVLMASMWYLAASWNPNPRMCSQVRGVVRNFIWGAKPPPLGQR